MLECHEHEPVFQTVLPAAQAALAPRESESKGMIWENEIVEAVAKVEHEQRAHMLDNLTAENEKRWRRLISTRYEDLTEEEKESDRVWALKALKAAEFATSRETISVCRICEAQLEEEMPTPHAHDGYIAAARWVTPWREFEDPLKAGTE